MLLTADLHFTQYRRCAMYPNVTIIGGGVLGTQIGLMAAYTGHHVTFWLRSEGSIGRTQPKLDHYSQ
jgi:glycerol-3-phosphate dehydrogenase